jgi:hypothetical protein
MDNLDSFSEIPISYQQNLFDESDDEQDNEDNEDQQQSTNHVDFDMSGFNVFNEVIEATMQQPIHSYNDSKNDIVINDNEINDSGINDMSIGMTNEEKELNERALSMVAQLMNKSITANNSTSLENINEQEEAIEAQRIEEKKLLDNKKKYNNNSNNIHEGRPKSSEMQLPKGQTPLFPHPKELPLQSNHIINFETSPYAQPMGFNITPAQESAANNNKLKPDVPVLRTNHFPSAPATPSFNYDNRVFYGESKEFENPESFGNNSFAHIATPLLQEREPYPSIHDKTKEGLDHEEMDTQRSMESISSLGSIYSVDNNTGSSKTPFKESKWPIMPHVDQHIRNNQLTMINLTKSNDHKSKTFKTFKKRRKERKKSIFFNCPADDDDSTVLSEVTMFKDGDIIKGDDISGGYTEVDIRMMMVFIHTTCSGRMNSDPVVEAKRVVKEKEMKYLGKDSLLEFEITLPDLIVAFRRYHQAISYKKTEEQSRDIMVSFNFLIEQNNLSPIEWFCLNDIKGGLGGNGRLTFSELKRGKKIY